MVGWLPAKGVTLSNGSQGVKRMQRRRFIATLAGAAGALVGLATGATALVTEARGRGGTFKARPYLIGEGAGCLHITPMAGKVERVWFDRELVYSASEPIESSRRQARAELKTAIRKALTKNAGQG